MRRGNVTDKFRFGIPEEEEEEGFTVRLREMETGPMETILEFASVSPRKMETLLLGSWWP